jgi:hypothetical protein
MQLSLFSAYPGGWLSQLIRIGGVLVYLHLLVSAVDRKNNAGDELHQIVVEVFRCYFRLAFQLIVNEYPQIVLHFRCRVRHLVK